MAKITFIILAHENADHVAELAETLTSWNKDAQAVIHYDLNSPAAQFNKLRERFSGSDRVHFVKKRVKCGWGDFSLVDSVVRALRLIRERKIDCDRVMLVSGSCLPIRPLAELSDYLDAHPQTEFIETYDSDWMVGGLRKERYQYWHLFNHQTQHRLFSMHYSMQKRFWPKRRFPRGLEPRFGSQWWCLSWALCEKILDYIQKHPMVYFFFSTTWIPDEMFFQTMAFKFTPNMHLSKRTLTFFHFNDWGKPIVLLDDHLPFIKELPFFFARKVSSNAKKLRAWCRTTAMEPAPAPDKMLKIDFSIRYEFPFDAMLNALPKADPLVPVLFQYRPENRWSAMLDKCPASFVILYGPPQLTRRASAALRSIPGLTAFGRIFHPDKVDLGEDRKTFHGLHWNDHKIRDIDRPSYLGRVLSRTEGLAVIELCPGDHPFTEVALLESRNAIVLPIVSDNQDEVLRELFYVLCASAVDPGTEQTTGIANYRSMQQAVELLVPIEFRRRTSAYLDIARASDSPSLESWMAALNLQHGSCVEPLREGYQKLVAALDGTAMGEIAAELPEHWRAQIAHLETERPRFKALRLNFPITMPLSWEATQALEPMTVDKLEKEEARKL